MKILILSDLYPPYYKGGHEIRCKMVAEGLYKKGHNVFVLTSRYGVTGKKTNGKIFRSLYFYSILDGTKGLTRRCKQIKLAILSRLNYFIANKMMNRVNPDLVYAGQVSGISIFPIKAIQKRDIPIVYHQGNYFFVDLVKDFTCERNKIKRFYRKVIFGFSGLDRFNFKHIITVSEAVKKKFVDAGFPKENIAIIRRSIPSESVKKEYKKAPNFRRKKIKLLYVGRISRQKGIHIAIKVINYLRNNVGIENISLDIIGDGNKNYKKELQAVIEKSKLKDHIIFRGKMLQEEVFKEYCKYDLLLVPSIWEEPSANTILESMANGVPVIATNVGGIPETIENGKTGLLVPKKNPIKMAEAVKKLIDNPYLYEQLSIHGIGEIQEKYTNKKIIEQINNYLNDVFKKSKRNSI